MTSLTEVYSLFLASSGVQTDSRRLTENQLFFALKGSSFDGNLYAEKAILAGAYAAVVEFAAAVGKYAEGESGTAAKYAAE